MHGSITRSPTWVRWTLAAMLVAALAARAGWGLTRPTDAAYLAQLPDQLEYLELGRSLLAGEGLRFFDEDFSDHVYAFRAPGYPLLVAACGGNVRAIRIVQALLDTGTVLAAFVLARRWLAAGASLIAALLVAVNPFLVFFSALVLSETLFTTMLAWGMALLVRPARGMRWWSGAVLLALSVLVRPSALLLPVALGVVAAIANRRADGPYLSRWSPPVATTMLLVTALVLLPWGYRNSRVLGGWVFTTTNAGITLYDGFNPDATGASDQRFIRALPSLSAMSELERSDYLAQLARNYIRENPDHAARLTVIKVLRTWSPVPLSADYGTARNVVIAAAYTTPLYLLILLGLWQGRLPISVKALLVVPAIYLTAVHAISVGSLRYRIPADVPMAIIAATGVAHLRPVTAPPAESAADIGSPE